MKLAIVLFLASLAAGCANSARVGAVCYIPHDTTGECRVTTITTKP